MSGTEITLPDINVTAPRIPTPATISGTSWSLKAITVTLTLGQGTFGQTGHNTVKLAGLRCIATINKGGFPSADSANVRVYGVPPSVMNQVSTLGSNPTGVRQNNNVTIEAGDQNATSVVYYGAIQNAYQDYDESPETALVIDGLGGLLYSLKPVPPISFNGPSDVAQIMSGIANSMGIPFENNGVQITLANVYLCGTNKDQAYQLARAAGIQIQLDTSAGAGLLAIWPANKSRTGTVPLINAASGLVGYPRFRDRMMSFRCLFDAGRNIRIGGQIRMQSAVGASGEVLQANNPGLNIGGPNGTWLVNGPVVHTLASQVPGGPWFTDVTVQNVNNPQTGPG